MGAAGFANNPSRIGRADFVSNFANDQYGVITHVDNTAATTGGAFFITAFSLGSWLAILSLAVLFTFLKLLDQRFAPPDENYRPLNAGNWLQRKKHFLFRSKIPLRLRRAAESTGEWSCARVLPATAYSPAYEVYSLTMFCVASGIAGD